MSVSPMPAKEITKIFICRLLFRGLPEEFQPDKRPDSPHFLIPRLILLEIMQKPCFLAVLALLPTFVCFFLLTPYLPEAKVALNRP
jgi:hypothetical protein